MCFANIVWGRGWGGFKIGWIMRGHTTCNPITGDNTYLLLIMEKAF